MPSQKNINQLNSLKTKLSTAKSVVLSDYSGLSVANQGELRQKVKDSGGEFGVAKNNLLRLAIKDHLNDLPEQIDTVLNGPTAILFSGDDPISPLKALVEFAKEKELPKLKAGLMDGKILSLEDIKQLALLPGRNQLLAKLIGQLQAPTFGLVNVLIGNVRNLVYALKAIQEQKSVASR